MTPEKLLDLELPERPNDSGTLREYLIKLLADLWEKGLYFDSKRPYRDSGWHYDIYEPMVQAGIVNGSFDEDGYLDEVDVPAAHRLVAEAIQVLAHRGGSG